MRPDPTRANPCQPTEQTIVRWSGTDHRALLEALANGAGPVVQVVEPALLHEPREAASSTRIRLLAGCRASGRLAPLPASATSARRRRIGDHRRELPLGASADAASDPPLPLPTWRGAPRGIELELETYPSTRWQLLELDDDRLSGDCSEATHVVSSVELGSYRLLAELGLFYDIGDENVCRQIDERAAQLRAGGEKAVQVLSCTGASARAVLLAGHGPLSLSLLETQDGTIAGARHLSLVAPADEVWELRQSGQPLCRLPCDRWLIPNEQLVLERRSAEETVHEELGADLCRRHPQREVALEFHSETRGDGSWPLFPILLSALGTAGVATAVAILVAGGGASPGQTPSGLSSIAASGWERVAGSVGVGAISAVSLGSGLVWLFKGPSNATVVVEGSLDSPASD